MSFSNHSLESPIIPPRPGAPVPPDSPVKAERPQPIQPRPQLVRKRVRSVTTIIDPEAPLHHRKRQKGIKGAVQRAASIISAALSRESLKSLKSSNRHKSSFKVERSPSPEEYGSRFSSRPESVLSLTSPISPAFSNAEVATAPTSDLRATPISRSVIWSNRESGGSITSERNQMVKINRFVPRLQSDLVIHSNDARPVTFYVDTRTVFDASPVLRFRASEIGSTSMRDARAIVILTVDEPGNLLRDLLSLIYVHKEQPLVTSGDELDILLGLARRYGVASALHTLCSTHLRDLAVHEPLRAYGLACKHNLHAEKAWTARETLGVHLAKADITHDLASCMPAQIRNLVQMHARRSGAAHALISAARSCDEFTCPGEHCEDGVAEWWLEVIKQSKAELAARPNSDAVFSPIFLAGCVRVASAKCTDCPMQFFGARTQHRLMRLKDDIDALPTKV